ncbi:geranylgeranyl pyrophosphate synthetase [Recurvomyces mirabilis]|uniref:Geranylgeranyl pyrophosphate synthetase n=1 Tax=Recurvomyces mirabilis TaxID=574656 RepID=A0AAE0TSQ0_9PEZI|nr:geranylgeranyl pyrophosphate synthetase [Recurvomyces mirabilis]KAK5151628.1 geranylgeranyl pyrophosphate synthetase [Recurvomyces mirabilis]
MAILTALPSLAGSKKRFSSASAAAPQRPLSVVSVQPPQIELPETEDYDLGYDPASFETAQYHYSTTSRPTTAPGEQSPDSPTLGSAHPSPTFPSAKKAGGGKVSEADGEAQRWWESKRKQEMAMASAVMETGGEHGKSSHTVGGSEEALPTTTTTTTSRPTTTTTPPSSSHAVNPATIPIRTSSSHATEQRDSYREPSYTPSSPTQMRSPKKHRSLMSVPEEKKHSKRASMSTSTAAHPDERDWLTQIHRTNGYPHDRESRDRGYSSGKERASRYTPSTFSQQPTLTPTAPEPSRQSTERTSTDLIDEPAGSSWSSEKETILKGPFDYLESHPGKDIRTQMIHAFNAWLRVPAASLAIITKVVAQLHTASLLIDDVEDSSHLRRGVPVAHHIFGAAQTINSANYVYFCALQDLLTLENPEVIKIYTDELLNLHRGQGMDLFWRDTLTCPSEDDYLEMVGNKTGGLFRLAIKLMCAESPSHNFAPSPAHSPGSDSAGKPDYIPLVNTMGLLFQILDDYRNLDSPTYTANKGLCEDLTEGKFSFPVIHAIRSDPTNLTLINILKQKTENEEVKRYAVAYLEKCGSFAYSRRVLRGLTKKALGLVEGVDLRLGGEGKGEGVRGILEKMRVERQQQQQQQGRESVSV